MFIDMTNTTSAENPTHADLLGQWAESRRGFALFAVLLLVLSLAMGVSMDQRTARLKSGKDRYLVEDAGISAVFAKYIASGEGFVYFPDGETVEGYSNPLWTFMLVAAAKAGVSPYDVARPFGLWSMALALFFGGLLIWWALPPPMRWLALLAPPIAGQSGTVVCWAISGLENGLYAMLLLAALAFFARERGNENATPVSGFFFFLVAITRPEGMLYGGMAGLFVLATECVPRRRITRRHVIFGASFLAPLIAYQLWRYWVFAWPFPNTYYAKIAAENAESLSNLRSRGWRYIFKYLEAYKLHGVLIAAALAPLSRRYWRQSLLLWPVLGFLLFFPIYAQGDWMKEWRFASTITALMVPMAVIGVARFMSMAAWVTGKITGPEWRHARHVASAAILASALGFVAINVGHVAAGSKRVREYVKDPEVNTFKLRKRGYYFREQADRLDLRPGSVLEIDMGGIGEASGMVIYDIGRLCDVPFGINRWDRRFVNDYIYRTKKPDFMHARRGWGKRGQITHNPFLKRDYIELPFVRRLGKKPNGNYVRRDLFIHDEARVDPDARHDFENGLSLLSGKVFPKVAAPKQQLRIETHWSTAVEQGTDWNVRYLLLDGEGREVKRVERPLVMRWYPTSKWRTDEYPMDYAKMTVPRDAPEGEYALRVELFGPDGETVDAAETPWRVRVSTEGAMQAKTDLAARIRRVKDTSPDGAKALLDELWYYRKSGAEKQEYRRLEGEVADAMLATAKTAWEKGDEATAADFAVKARKLAHLNDEIVAFAKKMAKLPFDRGRALMAKGDKASLDAAFGEFTEALRRYPRWSWARRYAEQTRPSGVIRRGERELLFVRNPETAAADKS
ncbi:MAG: hypothetical protein H6685_06810 [Deltaproteobacteria bacterium]|nr:hypothetical protein [Deltaproteobacteria bacterium]